MRRKPRRRPCRRGGAGNSWSPRILRGALAVARSGPGDLRTPLLTTHHVRPKFEGRETTKRRETEAAEETQRESKGRRTQPFGFSLRLLCGLCLSAFTSFFWSISRGASRRRR